MKWGWMRGLQTVTDVYEGAGPLGGLHAGLLASRDRKNLVIACDMPFAEPALARYFLRLLGRHDAVVPMLQHGPEPLFAAYRRSRATIGRIESNLKAGRLSMRGLLEDLDVVYVEEEDLRRRDPELHSFININLPEDYDAARRLLAEDG